jgi:hypothetical protein
MSRDDPLEEWLVHSDFDIPAKRLAELHAESHTGLAELTAYLDHPPKHANLLDVRLGMWNQVGLARTDLSQAQDLYRRVYVTGGAGNTYTQENLLHLIASTCDSVSIPFWLELLDLSRPRDSFTTKRRTMALAALAYLIIRTQDPAAVTALRQATRHANPDICALAVYYLGRAFLFPEPALPTQVIADLNEIAVHDTACLARFQARSILRAAQLPVPFDNPGGVYAFKVMFKWAKHIYRTIELKSEQTLEDLHRAIQQAIHWDSDHLYSFFMNGERWDERYAFACPYEEEKPPWTDEATIGELGLTLKHKFLYLFDYGDGHQFEIQIVGIHPQASARQYPRVVDSQGKAPEQYYSGEE